MLKKRIDKFFLNEKQTHKRQQKFYVSDASKCARQIFFSFKQAPKADLDPRMARIFQKGNKLHSDIFKIFFSLPDITVATEVRMPENDLLSGRADVIAFIDNEHYIIDIKSMNSFIFKKLTYPKPENVGQIQLYLHYFNIKNGILFYIDKDRQEIKEFIVSYSPLQVHFLLQGFRKLKKQIDKNEIPPVLSDYPKSWMCRYCRFAEICKELNKIKK